MSQNKYKCSGKDIKKNEQPHEKNPKKDVELCLEVEMDDEVREIITSPEKCTSTLLDVTVIKPKEIDRLYCSQKATLSGDEVRKLITSMELEKQDKQKLIDKILCSDDPRSSGDYVKKKYVRRASELQAADKHRTSTTDDTNSDVVYSRKHRHPKKSDDRVQQIYTTPKTYKDIKSIFTCKNKNRYDDDDKPDKPCSCRNCAVVGVLTDSQKKPFITENLHDPREFLSNSRKDSKDYKKKKYVNFKEEGHLECEYYFKHLSAKIRKLEERLAIQEERAVPRDYFKRIITKLVTHLSKITTYTGYDALSSRPKSKESKEPFKLKEKFVDNRYYVHPVLVDPKPGRTEAELVDLFQSSDQEKYQSPDGFWKWGEEILKPGIDLKNKIVNLLEDTLQSLKKPRSVPSKLGEVNKIVGCSFEPPQKEARPPTEMPVRDVPTKKTAICQCKNCSNVNKNSSGSTLLRPTACKSRERRSKRVSTKNKQETVNSEMVDVSYMNPQMWKWQEESQVSFKMDSSDMDSLRHSDQRKYYKSEFKDTLCNTNGSDKLKLWNSIWTQAKLNGQTKSDKVTIQIPEKKNIKSNKTVEIEYTIAELEELLVGKQGNHRKRSERK